MRSSPQDEQFRRPIREWLTDNLTGVAAHGIGEVISVSSQHP